MGQLLPFAARSVQLRQGAGGALARASRPRQRLGKTRQEPASAAGRGRGYQITRWLPECVELLSVTVTPLVTESVTLQRLRNIVSTGAAAAQCHVSLR
jgi:hypothetical protein